MRLMHPTRLRRATLADLNAVYRLETAGFVPGIVEEQAVFARRIAAFPEGFLVLESDAGDREAAGAGAPRALLGYFCAEIWSAVVPRDRGQPDWPVERFHLNHDIGRFLDRAGSVLYNASMTVDPACRGSGLGRRLFGQAINHLCGDFPALRQAVLIVNEHWAGARAIYADAGFAVTGCLEGFFQPQVGPIGAAIMMERALPL